MEKIHTAVVIVFLYFICIISVVNAPPVVQKNVTNIPVWYEFWIFRLFLNLLGYSTIIAPAYLLIRYLKKTNYAEQGVGFCAPTIKLCVFGDHPTETTIPSSSPQASNVEKTSLTRGRIILLLFCAAGLQISYLTWGVIQERIMTIEYGRTTDMPGEKFSNSQFLVFVNRLLAFCVAGAYMTLVKQRKHGCPLYKFSYSSFSNIMSSWFQYEALKFVSFPTQVMGKACKVIPVMLMGKVVSGNVYEMYEWVTAGMLSFGISLFLLSQGHSHDAVKETTDDAYSPYTMLLSGVLLMLGYMAFDSFTSNWQGELFKVHKMSSVQMMFGVNLFSCIFTACSLLEQGAFTEALSFLLRHWDFGTHISVLSVCSAVGQLFIFHTIAQFGPVVFTIIMTLRQALAILLSCLIYGHPVGFLGFVGILVVFLALFLRVYARSRKASLKKQSGTGVGVTKA